MTDAFINGMKSDGIMGNWRTNGESRVKVPSELALHS